MFKKLFLAALGLCGSVRRLLVAPWSVGSSQTRNRTCISCIGRQILNYWSTREVSVVLFLESKILLGDLGCDH